MADPAEHMDGQRQRQEQNEKHCQQPDHSFHCFSPSHLIVQDFRQSFRPELAMVSTIWPWERMKIVMGTIMTTTVTAAAWPVRAMPPA